MYQISHGTASESYLKKLYNASAVSNINASCFVNTTEADLAKKMFERVDGMKHATHALNDGTKDDHIMLDNIAEQTKYIHLHYEHFYTCPEGSHTYNDMAMLWINGGVKGVKVLMWFSAYDISQNT